MTTLVMTMTSIITRLLIGRTSLLAAVNHRSGPAPVVITTNHLVVSHLLGTWLRRNRVLAYRYGTRGVPMPVAKERLFSTRVMLLTADALLTVCRELVPGILVLMGIGRL